MPRTASGLRWDDAGAGAPLLLIHAGIDDRSMWDRQFERWGERYRVIRYDQRGFGDSDDPSEPFSLHGDALEVLDAAGAERAIVLGASIGGRVAVDLALAAPERIAALVAIVATPSGWEHQPGIVELWEQVDAAWDAGERDAANELELRMWVDGAGRDPEGVDAGLRARTSLINGGLLERQSELELEPEDLDPPAIGRLAEVRVPTLVLTGALDQPSVNAGAAALAAGIEGAETVEIAGTAHLPSLERPDEFDAAVLDFLERRTPASGA